MQKILALWAVPRSTSTAFEWMMRMRGDMACFHEPFGEAWYQGEDPLWPRLQPDSLRTPGLTLDSVWQMLQDTARQGAVFIKEFPHYLDHMWDVEFLSHFNHSFLIRDPAKTITSMYKHWPDFHPKEVGFAEQRQLFDLLCDQLGKVPPVIDSDDLLEDPYGMVESYCQAVGIPFIAGALSWEPGARDEVSWWDGGSFHQNLRDSDGLKPQVRKYIDIAEAPDRVKEVYESVLPYYEALYQHRLTS
ncbi:MAG: sulfotransferase family protein [Chloroflexota bacterium]